MVSSPDDPPATACGYPLKLEPVFQERVWGREDLSFLYTNRPARPRCVGEVWLTGDDNRITNGVWSRRTLGDVARVCGTALVGQNVHNSRPPGMPEFPLLVKFLFTTDKLSVQVHPPDSYALRWEGSAGKTEMWYVLKAEPGAQLAIGFREDLAQGQRWTRETLRKAVETGTIDVMLNWMDVRAGDTFFVPAGTVHAIGPGLMLCEIQQNSDVTYRLFDYNRPGTDGRPRPLHVEKALDVLEWRSDGGATRPLELAGGPAARLCLAACPYFATERWVLDGSWEQKTQGRFEIWIALEGEAEFQVAKEQVSCRKGEVIIIPADAPTFSMRPLESSIFLRTFPPDLEIDIVAPLRAQGYSSQQLERVCFSTLPSLREDRG